MNNSRTITEERLQEQGHPQAPPAGAIHKVSVIIPAYNAGRTVEACLQSLHAQSYAGEYEIVLVDNGSTDDTVAKAETTGVSKVIAAPDSTVYGARNIAAAQSAGDVLAFIDSDCVADQNWLAQGVEMLTRCHVVSGRILPQKSDNRLLYYYDKYVARAYKDRGGVPVNIAAGNAFIRRNVFDELGGFCADVHTAGDSMLSMQARAHGFLIQHSQKAIVFHPVDGFKRRLKGAFREGGGSALKSPIRYDGQTKCKTGLIRLRNFSGQIMADFSSVRRARQKKSFGSAMALRLLVFSVLIKLVSYFAVFCSRYCRPITHRFARR